jgi:hypothetical protein
MDKARQLLNIIEYDKDAEHMKYLQAELARFKKNDPSDISGKQKKLRDEIAILRSKAKK